MCSTTVSLIQHPTSVVKTVRLTSRSTADDRVSILSDLFDLQHPRLVRVISVDVVDQYTYSYEMEKLLPLSKDEDDFLYLLFGEDDLLEDQDSTRRFQNTSLADERRGELKLNLPEGKRERLESFAREVNQPFLARSFASDRSYQHIDLHTGNVMKDERGYYRLIDLEGIYRND